MATQQFEDPKIILTIKIIDAQEEISFLLNNGLTSKAAKEMATLLLRVHIPEDEKEIRALQKQLTPEGYHLATEEEVFRGFALISDFLNRTYFADYHTAKPRFGAGKL